MLPPVPPPDAPKRPRRRRILVIAGALLSALAIAGIALILIVLLARRAMAEARTRGGGLELTGRAIEFRADNGRWPKDEVECFGAELPPFDAWGTPLSLRIEGDADDASLFAWCAGRDRKWGTPDDWVVASEPRDAAKQRGFRQKP